MGCWNKTCGLSNLYIKAGQEAYVFPLVKRSQDGERCYSHAFWKPMLLPFVTEYNDYGGGKYVGTKQALEDRFAYNAQYLRDLGVTYSLEMDTITT